MEKMGKKDMIIAGLALLLIGSAPLPKYFALSFSLAGSAFLFCAGAKQIKKARETCQGLRKTEE